MRSCSVDPSARAVSRTARSRDALLDAGRRWSGRLDRWGLRLGLTGDSRGLVRLGVLTLLAYGLLAFYPDRPYRLARELAAWAAILVLLFLYHQGVRHVRAAGEGAARAVFSLFPLVALAAALVWPFHSADVYAYVNTGWLQAHYHLDPYVHAPRHVVAWRSDPTFSGLWIDQLTPYGFLFAHLTRGVAWLGGGSVGRMVALFKAMDVLALAFAGGLVLSAAGRLGQRAPARSLYLLLFSPLLLLHHVSNAHNDVLMGAFVVLALWLAVAGRAVWVLPALAAAVLLKWVAIVCVPFALVFLLRRHGRRRAALGLFLGVVVASLVSLPYVLDLGAFRTHEIAGSLSAPLRSLQASLVGLFRAAARLFPALGPGVGSFRTAVGAVFAAGYAAFLGLRTVRAARAPSYGVRELAADTVLSLLVLTCVASPKFGPWYLGMFLPAALLLDEGHPVRRLALWLSIFGLLGFTFFDRARILDALVMTALPILLFLLLERRPVPVGAEAPS